MRRMPRLGAAALFLLATLLMAAAPARAAGVPPQRAAYSAEQVVTVNGGTLTASVNHLRGMERRRMTADGLTSLLLIRPDKGKAWQIQPDMGLALELPLSDPEAGPDLSRLWKLDAQPVGKETVAGLPVTKYRVRDAYPEGGGFDGFVWSTADGIYARVDGAATDGGEPQRVMLELKSIKPGPQDPTLFELPPGLRTMSLDVIEGRTPPAFAKPPK